MSFAKRRIWLRRKVRDGRPFGPKSVKEWNGDRGTRNEVRPAWYCLKNTCCPCVLDSENPKYHTGVACLAHTGRKRGQPLADAQPTPLPPRLALPDSHWPLTEHLFEQHQHAVFTLSAVPHNTAMLYAAITAQPGLGTDARARILADLRAAASPGQNGTSVLRNQG